MGLAARKVYRRTYDIPDELGTAVNVVQMVFGNKGDESGTGVAFTRDPSTGEPGLYGEFLANAQGEDVVSGIRTPEPLAHMEQKLPAAFRQLIDTMRRLEEHYRDMQDIEFTVEDNELYLLQTRSAKRTAAAAVKAAVDMVDEGLISREDAVARIDPAQLDQLLHPMIDPTAEWEVATKGLNASPGAACGAIVLDADTAEQRGKAGESVILVRWETTPDDIHGLIQAAGILTAHGGMTSHAAVVARGMGKPCVAGCEGLSIDIDARTITVGDRTLSEGDVLTIDGGTGAVIVGEVPLVAPEVNDDLETILGWGDEHRTLKVRANADTPEDAAKAREFGAQGIGLCRTEHMFMAEDRLPVVREMILADSEEGRRGARQAAPDATGGLRGHLRSDGRAAGDDPSTRSAVARVPAAAGTGDGRADAPPHQAAAGIEPDARDRGCRLGLQWPEIYEMQVRAIIRAARAVDERTGEAPLVEIMHPLVGFAEELRRLRELTVRVAEEEAPEVEYLCGTMIELPRACIRADEIAEQADFFSFGTNDLTQTALGFSRDDAEGKFLTHYLEDGVLEKNPFETLDVEGVGDLMRIAVERGRSKKPDIKLGICGEHGETRSRWPSATSWGSTTSAARPTACRSHVSPRHRRRSLPAEPWRTRPPAADDRLRDPARRRARGKHRLGQRRPRLDREVPRRSCGRRSCCCPRPDSRARHVCLAHRRQAHRPRAVPLTALPTWDEVRARRLARSFLTTRASPDRLLEVVHDLGGVHAQVQASAELQLAVRVDGITQQDIRDALWERRELVKAWTLRGTLHLHPADELPLWYAAARAVWPASRKSWKPGSIRRASCTRRSDAMT